MNRTHRSSSPVQATESASSSLGISNETGTHSLPTASLFLSYCPTSSSISKRLVNLVKDSPKPTVVVEKLDGEGDGSDNSFKEGCLASANPEGVS